MKSDPTNIDGRSGPVVVEHIAAHSILVLSADTD
jgi:hypothetical protein